MEQPDNASVFVFVREVHQLKVNLFDLPIHKLHRYRTNTINTFISYNFDLELT
jgi:hypothetical protein